MNDGNHIDFEFDLDGVGAQQVVPTDLSDNDFLKPKEDVADLGFGRTQQNTQSNPAQSNPNQVNPDSTNGVDVKVEEPKTPVTPAPNTQTPTADTDDNFDDYSKPALFAKLLAENNLDFFGDDIPKDLDIDGFVTKFNETSTNFINNQLTAKLEEVGEIADYIQYRLMGGSQEMIDPAIEAERYANFNINHPDVTEDDLSHLVEQMYRKQNIPENRIPGLLKVDREEGLLNDKAQESINFHKEFRDNAIKTAYEAHERKIQQESQQRAQEASRFANELRNTTAIGDIPIDDNDRAEIYDFHHKRDQLVKYTDPQSGKLVTDYLTKYELLMYQTVNDPSKLIRLTYSLKHDFDLTKNSKVINTVSKNVNSSLLRAIEGNGGKQINNNVRVTEQNPYSRTDESVVGEFTL